MSLRMLVYSGWLVIVVGVAMIVGIVAGSAGTGLLIVFGASGLVCIACGAMMVWLGRGWDAPLGSAERIHEYGRPANAEVLSVETAQRDAAGTRTAKLSVRVSPVNESEFKSTRTVAVFGGREPAVGQRVTVKFDPHRRKDFVLLDHTFEVQDPVARTADAYFGGLQR